MGGPRIQIKLNMRIVRGAAIFLLLGLFTTVMIAWGLAARVPMRAGASATVLVGGNDWHQTVAILKNIAGMRITSTTEYGLRWSPDRAAGPPDTHSIGDIATAWASRQPDDRKEWLELDYAEPVVPVTARVFETYCPGALVRVTAFDEKGNEIEAWSGVDPARPNEKGIWVAEIPLSITVAVSRIKLHIDSPKVQGWNEIDAVGLIDRDGKIQWATAVRASTTYASNYSQPGSRAAQLDGFLPGWAAGLKEVQRPGGRLSAVQTRVLDARGWPMLALWGEVPPTTVAGGWSFYPLQPIWKGLLVDTAFYALIIAILYGATFGLRRFVRESLWLRRGCCIQCGYDLRFDLASGCPECGWRRKSSESA